MGKKNLLKKIFVLDTSVILYDHHAVNNFQEHDVAVPALVLEELDHFKSGNDTRNFEARSFIRLIDMASKDLLLSEWVSLKEGNDSGLFQVLLDEQPAGINAETLFGKEKFDNRILNATLALKEKYPQRKVILVSKDICLRLKAKALNLYAEDYETGKVKDVDTLYTGQHPVTCTSKHIQQLKHTGFLPAKSLSLPYLDRNHFYTMEYRDTRLSAFFDQTRQELRLVSTASVFQVQPRNEEQAFALDALLNPAIRLVTIQGNAGTGKTLLALASALEQRKQFRQIYVTRPIVPLSNKEIGFLPGDAKDKVDPYMAPIWDNLKFIREQFSHDEKMQLKIDELIRTDKIEVAPLAFIRGRTISKVFFIVDEAQNLTPHEVKTIISRAGEHTKVVFTGDIYQIDTPYLDSESNGLSYLISRAQRHPLYAHITLSKGERSELSNLANELL